MARALLEAFRGVHAALSQIGARRTVVPLIEDIDAREGQIIAGVADGQVIKLPEAVQDGAIGQVTILLSDVKTPATVVHPDGSTESLTEPGIFEFALGSEGEQVWATPPGAIGGIRAISAGTTSASSGTIRLSNANGLSFGLAGNTLTGSYTVPTLTSLVYSNSNGITFGTAGSTLTASHDGVRSFRLSGFGNNSTFTGMTETAIGASLIHLASHPFATRVSTENVYFRLSGSSIGAYAFLQFQNQIVARAEFSDSNNVTFGSATSDVVGIGRAVVITASATVASTQGSIRLSAGTTSVLSSGFTLSNSNNVSFGIDAAGIVTGTATVASTQGSIRISAGTTSALSSGFTLSNSNNVSFGIDAAGVVTATATVAATRDIGLVSHIGGNVVSSVSRLVFSNASNVTWSLSTAANAATIIASVAAGGGGADGGIFASAAGSSQSAGNIVWSNANNVSFGMNGSTITATATVASSLTNIRLSAGTEGNLGSAWSFADSNGVSFGLNVSTITASARPDIGVVSHVGGNVVSSVTRLAFSNASNVTFSLSTAANAATLLASVATAAGGIAAGDGTATVSTGTLIFTNETSATNFATASISARNVVFDITGQSIGATALMRFQDGTNSTQTGGFLGTKLQFASANGVSFGLATTNDAQGRNVVMTASTALFFRQPGGLTENITQLNLGGNIRISTFASIGQIIGADNDSMSFYRNIENVSGEVNTASFATASLLVSPFQGGRPFPAPMIASTFEALVVGAAATATNSSFGFTLRGGVYTLANSTQLSMVNSFSFSFSLQSTASANRNSSHVGARWLQLSTSNWSSSPVFSQGVQYWLASNWQTAGLQVVSAALGQEAMGFAGNPYRGTFGVTATTDAFSRILPMAGWVNTTNPPTTIGSAGFVNPGAGVASGFIPAFQFRNAVFQ